MSPLAYQLLNGVRHGWSSVEAKFGAPVNQVNIAFKSLNYKRTRTREMLRGNHPDPLGKTRGTNEYTADCEMPLAEANLLISQLQASVGGVGGWGDVFFDLVVSYTENGFDTITHTIKGCTLDEVDASMSEGAGPLMRKFVLNPLKILDALGDDLAVPLQAPAA